MLVKRECKNCGKEFDFKPSQINAYRGAGQFCTRDCHYGFYRKNPTLHPLYKGAWAIDSHGYRTRWINRDGKKEYIREHRFLMEQKLGRKLLRSEHVHHINGVKSDNRLSNLTVLSESDHHRIHGNNQKMLAAIERGRKTLAKKWAKWRESHWSANYSSCVVCSTTAIKHQGQGKCRRCYLKSYARLTRELQEKRDGVIFGKH